jgi:glucose dehydrogenase
MCAEKCSECDVVIVGSGVAGALMAKRLAQGGKKVVILEAGAEIPANINTYMNRFFRATNKVPESPYTPALSAAPSWLNAGRPTSLMIKERPERSYLVQDGPLAFGSTYERIGGGTALHWLGTSLRLVPNDFRMESAYKKSDDWPAGLVDWPIDYDGLNPWYGEAEAELGVSGDVQDQAYLGIRFPPGYAYRMPGIPLSKVDAAVADALDRLTQEDIGFLELDDPSQRWRVISTPAARNSLPYQNRRVCAGNTNCIPICPIQAKYDPTVTLNEALDTGKLEIWYRTVAKEVAISESGRVSRIDYIQYRQDIGGPIKEGCISAKIYVLAGNAIETPRLLLMSKNYGRTARGVANGSDLVGRNLMDHPYYVAWALMPEGKPVYPYRGPLATGGIEDLVRDGSFRCDRAAFRIEIGNEGWNFVVGGAGGDPDVTTVDFVSGRNRSGLNYTNEMLFGGKLAARLNDLITRQIRLGFLIEQTPDCENRVTLSDKYYDGLGLPRPAISYDLSDYTKKGIVAAKLTADLLFDKMAATSFTKNPEPDDPMCFEWPINGEIARVSFGGAGHLMGTYRMGSDPKKSVVDSDQRSWDHPNLFLVGSGVFPTTATANPTLTLAALVLRTARVILDRDLS